jgi:hypothetical protein
MDPTISLQKLKKKPLLYSLKIRKMMKLIRKRKPLKVSLRKIRSSDIGTMKTT